MGLIRAMLATSSAAQRTAAMTMLSCIEKVIAVPSSPVTANAAMLLSVWAIPVMRTKLIRVWG